MIKPRGSWLLCLALTLTAAALATSRADASDNAGVVGTWNLELEFQGQKQSIELVIRQTDGELAGTWIGPHRTNELDDVNWDGTTLTFVRNRNRQGTPVALRTRATVVGDDMKGTITQPEGEISMTGKRAHDEH